MLEEVENKIIEINGQKVIIDSDVAELYGVQTKEINKAVKNNPEKFLTGYIIELTKKDKDEVVKNFHHLNNLKFSPHLPKAFTEKGLYMLATILKSPRATQTTIAIIEAFAKIRNLSRNIKELPNVKNEKRKQDLLQSSGKIIADMLDNSLVSNESEIIIEINLAVVKFKYTTKQGTRKTKKK
jgi:phage regulator Rha-like protein